MDISVLIPWRTDHGPRERAFDHVRALWEDLPVELVIGVDNGTPEAPFNVSRAFNDAAAKASGDVFVLFGADHLPDFDRVTWAATQLEANAWCALFARTGKYSETDTNAIIDGADPARFDYEHRDDFCYAIIGITRPAWELVHGMDERFQGWGGEDTAFRMALDNLYGPTPAPSDTLRCLWHPEASRDKADRNWSLVLEYEAAARDNQMRGYLDTRR